MNIKISVIIPAYNVEKYIERTIKSVINQSLNEIEVLIINDGSKDNTLDILKKLAEEDLRIKIISKENEGVSKARNIGIENAKGKYIYFLDGDDWIEGDTLKEMHEYIEDNKLDMVIADYYRDYNDGKLVYTKDLEIENKIISSKEYVKEFLNGRTMRGICCRLIKRKLFIENNIYFPQDIRIGEDVITILRLGFIVEKIGKIDKAYLHYMENVSSVTKKNRAHLINEYFKIYEILKKFLEKRNLYEKYQKLIYRHKVFDFKDFMFQDYDWNNPEYIKATEKFLEIVKDKNLDENLDILNKKQKFLWKILKIYPNKFILKQMTTGIKRLLNIKYFFYKL